MNGSTKRGATVRGDVKQGARERMPVSDIPWSEVQGYIARAHAMRSAYLTEWLKRHARSWANVFRRPRYLTNESHWRGPSARGPRAA